MKKIIFLTALTLASAVTYAGGYRVAVQGNRSLAMGHTGVAVVNSAELAFHNPAGLVYLENKLAISAGATAVFSEVAWQNQNYGEIYRADNPVATPFYLNAAYKINDNVSVGLSITTPYGSTVEWPIDWPGSHLVNNISLQAFYIQPLVAYKISDFISVGGGPILVVGGVEFNRNLTRTLTDIDGNRSNVTIDASGVTEFGWSASAMINPAEGWRIGVNYRSEVTMNAEGGDADFQNIPNTPLAPFQDTTFDAALPMPAELAVGVSYEMNDTWLFAFDYNRSFWGVYESLDITFANGVKSENARNYKDANIWRFGVQYAATDKFTLRAGYYYDQTPVQEGYFAPETPRNDSQGFTAGLSIDVSSRLALDASFAYVRFSEVDASYDHYQEDGINMPFRGTYKSNAFIAGLGVTYKL